MDRKDDDLITYGKPQPKEEGSPFLKEIQGAIDNILCPDGRKLMHHWRGVGRRYAVYRVGNHLHFIRAQLFSEGWRVFHDRKVEIET
jgi:hypothetical protein